MLPVPNASGIYAYKSSTFRRFDGERRNVETPESYMQLPTRNATYRLRAAAGFTAIPAYGIHHETA